MNTLQGALEGVPNLLRLLDEYGIQASFFFAMGPDLSGRRRGGRALQPWRDQLSFGSRLYGTLLLPPNISRRAADVMRSVDAAGHETGLLAYDRLAWVTGAAFADAAWTESELRKAVESYEAVFGKRPRAFAAAAWQVNP
ncbi:MAG: polysaccharide deacetylase family protein, partial [Candidatus Thiodiazotropha sp.]